MNNKTKIHYRNKHFTVKQMLRFDWTRVYIFLKFFQVLKGMICDSHSTLSLLIFYLYECKLRGVEDTGSPSTILLQV